jgi:hypothetical protein
LSGENLRSGEYFPTYWRNLVRSFETKSFTFQRLGGFGFSAPRFPAGMAIALLQASMFIAVRRFAARKGEKVCEE